MYCWFTFLYSRNQLNILKQLYTNKSNLKNKKNDRELNALIWGDSEDTWLCEESNMQHNAYNTTLLHDSV